jgi:F0F1-type ATP synthase epsilon subunit
MTEQTLQVEVRSRQGLIFQGELYAVTSYNSAGEFDVLPTHANFVSMISKKVILRKPGGQTDELLIDNGIMMVEDNQVKVFIGISRL